MSQIYKTVASTPAVPIQFTTDVKDNTTTGPGTAVPSANNLNVLGGSTSDNNANGIRTDANPNNSDNLYVELTNRLTGSVSTTGAASATLMSLPLGATPGIYTFDILVAAFAKTGIGAPAGAGYTIVGSVRTDGATATLIPTQVVDHFEEAVLLAPQPTAVLAVSGNDAIVTVTGKSDGAAGFVIDWSGYLTYTLST